MAFEPYNWQERDLKTLEENDFVGLLNIQMGGGKTPLSIWSALRAGAEQVLVIAPQNTHRSAWQKTIRELTGNEARVIGNKNKAQKEAYVDFEMGEAGWYLVTPQLMGHANTDISSWMPDFLICDEVHTYNKPGGKQAKRWMELGERMDRNKLALSGTPIRRSFERMWTNMRFLWPWLDRRGEIANKNHYLWLRERMTSEEIYTNQRDQWGKAKTATKWLVEAEPGLLISEAPCVIQHFRRDTCCPDHIGGFLKHEAPQEIEVEVELLPAQRRAIKDMENMMLMWLEDNPMVADIPLTQKLRIRQMCLGVPRIETYQEIDAEGLEVEKQTLEFDDDCKSPVIDKILEILEKEEEGEPVIIYLEMQRFAPVIVKRLQTAGYTAAEFSGNTVKEREKYLDRFGVDLQVLVGTTASISNGTDGIQSRCSTEIIAQGHVDDTLMEQQAARTDRLGSKGQTVRYIIVDDEGYAKGQYSDQFTKRLNAQKSTVRQSVVH